MDNKYFNEIYNDFFGTKEITIDNNQSNTVVKNNIEEVDDLLIDDCSKDLVKKIINYMESYTSNDEKKYLNFNIMLEGNNKNNSEQLSGILSKVVEQNHYCLNSSIYKLSLYELGNKIELNNIYNNGIVLIEDLDGFLLLDENNKKIFLYQLKNNLVKHNITILHDDKAKIEMLLSYDKELQKDINFRLIEVIPSIQEIYNDIINDIKLDDEMNIKLLDYIQDSYSEINDYSKYKDNLISYLSFHKDVPKIKEVKTIDEVFKELDSLVGLQEIKKTLRDLVNLINLQKKSDVKINNINLHMLFLGNPGTGKTTVARLLANILYQLGYIKENKLLEVTSKDLVAEYVGQTSIKTYSVIERALGGILFIDEAYSLASKNSSYNDEAIATLIKAMEDNRDNLVVIFAGYTKEMNDFINSNSGIASRIGYTLNFVDYTEDELVEILKGMFIKAGFTVDEKALLKARNIISEHKKMVNFGNARFVRNMYEKTIIRHATNTKDYKRKDLLIKITEKDINIDNLM